MRCAVVVSALVWGVRCSGAPGAQWGRSVAFVWHGATIFAVFFPGSVMGGFRNLAEIVYYFLKAPATAADSSFHLGSPSFTLVWALPSAGKRRL